MVKRILWIAGVGLLTLVLVTASVGFWLLSRVRGSLPLESGQVACAGLDGEVRIERDGLGVPTIRAANRLDLAFATGFVHSQERFFQMDLLRRNAAGELSELIGPATLDSDREVRRWRFRHRAERVLEVTPADELALVRKYADGVNAGLAALSSAPYEYLVLGTDPAPWRPEDSTLVLYAMYLDLQGDSDIDFETTLALLHDKLPAPLAEFLAPRGTEWDAPIHGQALAQPPVPGPEVFDLRAGAPAQAARRVKARPELWALRAAHHQPRLGSNGWAVAGKHTRHGGAIVADDMHLGIRVPNIWYRASFVWPEPLDPASGGVAPTAAGERPLAQITGVTLPGTPAMVVGSNQHVAWAFTNSEGDWLDLVIVEPDPADASKYLTPEGPQAFEVVREDIAVRGAEPESLEIRETIWGPLVEPDHAGRLRAARWVALDTEGVNLGLLQMESVRTLEDALRQANLSGSPAQNFTVGDAGGRIAWTILGRIPRREGFDGRLPASWADGQRRWNGYLEPEEYPRIVDPESGRIWTANARIVSDELLQIVGDGDYDLGARQQQIRDDLLALDQVEESDMLRVQLDDRAVLLGRWRELALELLSTERLADHPLRAEARQLIDNWGGRAAVDSAGYFLVRAFRYRTIPAVINPLAASCLEADQHNQFDLVGFDRVEGPLWALVSERPPHLLDPDYASWDELLLEQLDAVLAEVTAEGLSLARQTWGRHNTSQIRHPLSLAISSQFPWLGRQLAPWLDMPAQPLAGDRENLPRIQGPSSGASERMAVSPGRESAGYLHMPGGQSGHFLSPHYGDQHQAWVEGETLSFLPGPTRNTLVLTPGGSQ